MKFLKGFTLFIATMVTFSWCLLGNALLKSRPVWSLGPCQVTESVDLTLKPYGAEGYVDIVFKAPSNFPYYSISPTESLEVETSIDLPRFAAVESLWLWIDSLKQPALHIGRGQAEATYNQIVNIERKDPALLTIDYRTDEYDRYRLRVFPIFKGGERKVRIKVNFAANPWKMSEEIPLGVIKKGTELTICVDSSVKSVPFLSDGRIQYLGNTSERRYAGVDFTGVQTYIRWGSTNEPVERVGVSGRLDIVEKDTSYFSLRIDMAKFLEERYNKATSSFVFAWIPNNIYHEYSSEYYAILNSILMIQNYEKCNIFTANSEGIKKMADKAIYAVGSTAVSFLQQTPYSGAPVSDRSAFEVIMQAFSSINHSDSNAIVILIDRNAPSGYQPRNVAEDNRKEGELVRVNLYGARLVAFVHYQNKDYYEFLARRLNGVVYANSLPNMNTIRNARNFNFKEIRILSNATDVMVGNSYYYENDNHYITLMGRTTDPYILGELEYSVKGSVSSKAFAVTNRIAQNSGSDLRKLWIKEAINFNNFFREIISKSDNTWSTYYNYYNYLANPIEKSVRYGVLTSASALIALEPGQEPVEDTEGWQPSAGIAASCTTIREMQKSSLEINPNPFNPITKIDFFIDKKMRVKLAVYDLKGRLIVTLKEGVFEKGTYSCQFDASNLPGGVYLLRLEGTGLRQTRRITLIK